MSLCFLVSQWVILTDGRFINSYTAQSLRSSACLTFLDNSYSIRQYVSIVRSVIPSVAKLLVNLLVKFSNYWLFPHYLNFSVNDAPIFLLVSCALGQCINQ